MSGTFPSPAQAEELALALESLCTPDDQFLSHEDAVTLAWGLLLMAHRGDPLAQHAIKQTTAHARRDGS